MKLLALHGYTQDGTIFYKKTGVLRKQLAKEGINLTYVSAPHKVEPISSTNPDTGEPVNEDECRGWWKGQHWGSTKEIEKRMFTESMDFLVEHVKKEGPYDGVFGFSQGAAMAALLAAYLQTSPELGLQKPRFGVFIAGFDPTLADTFQPLMEKAGTIEVEGSLHVSGQRDTLVIPGRTKALMERFFDPATAVWHAHNGGHVVPSTSGDRKLIVDFCKKFLPEEEKKNAEETQVEAREDDTQSNV